MLPLIALKAGRGIGMRYRERLGTLKSKILESVYSIRDIQIFGAGPRKMQEVAEAAGMPEAQMEAIEAEAEAATCASL